MGTPVWFEVKGKPNHGPLLLDRLVCKRGALCGLDSLAKWYLYSLSNFVKL